jgi:ferredoxin
MSACINCGLCALAAGGRLGVTHIPDLPSAYLRPYPSLPEASGDVRGSTLDLETAAAACPVGVPLVEVAMMVQRLTRVNS